MNNPYSEHVSMVEKHIVRNNPAVKYFYRKQPSGKNVFVENGLAVKVLLQKIAQQ